MGVSAIRRSAAACLSWLVYGSSVDLPGPIVKAGEAKVRVRSAMPPMGRRPNEVAPSPTTGS